MPPGNQPQMGIDSFMSNPMVQGMAMQYSQQIMGQVCVMSANFKSFSASLSILFSFYSYFLVNLPLLYEIY